MYKSFSLICILQEKWSVGQSEAQWHQSIKDWTNPPPLDDKFMWLLCPTITEPSKNLRKGCLLRLKQVFVESGFWVKSKLTNKANPQWTPKIYDDLFSIYPSWFKKLKLRGTIERGHILKDHKRQVLTYWRW